MQHYATGTHTGLVGGQLLPESTGAKITDQTTDHGGLADSVHQTHFSWEIMWQYFSLWF